MLRSNEKSFVRAKIERKKVVSKLHCSNLYIRVANGVCMGMLLYKGQDTVRWSNWKRHSSYVSRDNRQPCAFFYV